MEIKKEYFAAQEPSELVSYLESEMGLSFAKRAEGRSAQGGISSLTNMWDKNFKAYYSNNLDNIWNSGGVKFSGREGELIMMSVNQARALLNEYNTLISKQRLAFEAITDKVDSETFQSTRLGSAISNQLVKDEKLDLKGDLLLENAGVLGAGYIYPYWNPLGGKLLSRNQLGSKYAGKLEYKVLSVYDVFFDYMNPDFYTQDWVVVSWEENRYDLAAQYPKLKDKILALPAVESRFSFTVGRRQEKLRVMAFIHKDSSALPNGRLTVFSSADVVYYDKPNPYGFINLVDCTPQKILGTGVGYPFFSELLPMQEMLDSTFSTIASNQAAFALQNVLVPNQADLNIDHIGGLNFLKYNMQANGGGEPKALELCKTPPECFKFIDLLIANQMTVSKVNSAIRGSPPPGVTAGTAIATLTANALELIQSGSKAYSIAMETLMDYSFRILQKFATEEQAVEMVGRNKRPIVKTWKAADISSIKGVKMKSSNPLAQTIAGRITITEHQMELGLIKTPEQYQMVMETGSQTQVNDQAVDEEIWIMEENDMIKEGKPVQAAICERHAMHYNGHKCLLFDPVVRNDPVKFKVLLAHLDEHKDMGKTTDPWILGVVETGQLPPPQPGMPPQGPPGMPQMNQAEAQAPNTVLGPNEPETAPVAKPATPEVGGQGVM